MLKTSGSTESTIRLGKGGVEVGGDGVGGSSGDFDRKYSSDAPKSICPPAPRTSMLRTSSSTDSSTSLTQIVIDYDGVDDGGGCSGNFNRKTSTSTDISASAAQIGVDYNGVDDGATSSILKTSSSTDSSTSAAQIVVEFDEISASGGAGGKSVKKSSKSGKIGKKSKKSQRFEKFAKVIGSEEHLLKHRSSVN